jgi:hypothetical protein
MWSIYRIGLVAALAGLALSTPAQADISNQTPVGETYATFLEIAQGARPAGMGDAYVAVADNVNAVFWNVAGLTDMPRKKFQFNFNNTQWLVDSQLNSGGIGVNTDFGALALSFLVSKPPKMPETTILKPDGTGRFLDTGSWAVGVAYAKKLTDRFSIGGQFRAVEERLDRGFNYRTFDVAVGTKYYTGFRSLRIAMSLRNFGKNKILLQNERIDGKMPAWFNVATAAEVIGKKGDPLYLTSAFEGLYSVSVEKRIHVGGELWLRNTLALRGGYKWNYDNQNFTAGAGVRLKRGDRYLEADFAWANFGKQFEAPLRFSVTGSF